MTFMAAILLTTVAAMAQHEEGDFMVQPKVGMNVATLSDADKAIVDLHFGVEAEYMVSDNFSLGLGAIVSNQGAKYDELYDNQGKLIEEKYTADLDYVHVPVLVSWYVLPGLALKAGVQPGFKMKAKAKFDDHTYDLDRVYQVNNLLTGEDIKVSKFDLSIPVGISYEYKNIVLDARYNWGLIKVLNQGDAFYNRCFMVSLGYKLELGD
jgi:hypothetical protein